MVWNIRKIDRVPIQKVYAVDTNVLYWMHYSRASLTTTAMYQIQIYPNFISELLSKKVQLVTTTYNIAELLSIIEKNEYRIYLLENQLNEQAYSIKQFRKNENERKKVKTELEVVLQQIEALYNIESFSVETMMLLDFVGQFDQHSCDNIDYVNIQYLKNQEIDNFISDDIDFVSIPKINLFTANNKAIELTRS